MSKEEDLKIAHDFSLVLMLNGEIRVATIGVDYSTVMSEPLTGLSPSDVM